MFEIVADDERDFRVVGKTELSSCPLETRQSQSGFNGRITSPDNQTPLASVIGGVAEPVFNLVGLLECCWLGQGSRVANCTTACLFHPIASICVVGAR